MVKHGRPQRLGRHRGRHRRPRTSDAAGRPPRGARRWPRRAPPHRGRRGRRRARRTAPACGRPRAGPPRGGRSGDGRPPMSSRRRSPCRPRPPARRGTQRSGSGSAAGRLGWDSGSGQAGQRVNNRLTSSSVCAADSVTRRRLVPTGTVGGRMAGTHRPSSSSAADASSAACSLPSTTGMIGLGCPGGANPASVTRSISAARRPVRAAPSADRTIRSAASAAAASAGVGAVEKMYERARLTMRSTMSRDAATKPPSEPNVFDSVPTRTTVPPCTPSRPRPPIAPPSSRRGSAGRSGPRTAWASSRMRRALWRGRGRRARRGGRCPHPWRRRSR